MIIKKRREGKERTLSTRRRGSVSYNTQAQTCAVKMSSTLQVTGGSHQVKSKVEMTFLKRI